MLLNKPHLSLKNIVFAVFCTSDSKQWEGYNTKYYHVIRIDMLNIMINSI